MGRLISALIIPGQTCTCQPNSSEFNDVDLLMIFLLRSVGGVVGQSGFILFLFLFFYKFNVVNIQFSP